MPGGRQRALQIGHVVFGNGQERPRRLQAETVERGPRRYVPDDDGEAQPFDERRIEGVLVALDGHAADSRLRQCLDNRGARGADATHDDVVALRHGVLAKGPESLAPTMASVTSPKARASVSAPNMIMPMPNTLRGGDASSRLISP